MGEKLRFEEKDFWMELEVDKNELRWTSNKGNRKEWPENGVKFYARELLGHTERLGNAIDDKKKLENFFEAKGFRYKQRLFKELFDIEWNYSKEELIYIEKTKEQAESHFGHLNIQGCPNEILNTNEFGHTIGDLMDKLDNKPVKQTLNKPLSAEPLSTENLHYSKEYELSKHSKEEQDSVQTFLQLG
ncbi:hypothetical protein [Priestia aryabhattai]